jgi:hypothetical protein
MLPWLRKIIKYGKEIGIKSTKILYQEQRQKDIDSDTRT